MTHRIYKWQRGDRRNVDRPHMTVYAELEDRYPGSWKFNLSYYRWLRRAGLGKHHARLVWWNVYIDEPHPHVIGRLVEASAA